MFARRRRDRASSRINRCETIAYRFFEKIKDLRYFVYRERDETLDSDAKMGGGRLIEHRRLVLLFCEMKTVKRRR